MSRVLDAIHWDGTTPVVSLFRVSPAQDGLDLAGVWGDDGPRQTKTYRLEDDRPGHRSAPVQEYDFEFELLPVDLKQRLAACLDRACEPAGSVAWLAFEGSFHFDHLLTEDVADQIYGICATGDPALVVLDDEPAGEAALRERIRACRLRLGLG